MPKWANQPSLLGPITVAPSFLFNYSIDELCQSPQICWRPRAIPPLQDQYWCSASWLHHQFTQMPTDLMLGQTIFLRSLKLLVLTLTNTGASSWIVDWPGAIKCRRLCSLAHPSDNFSFYPQYSVLLTRCFSRSSTRWPLNFSKTF